VPEWVDQFGTQGDDYFSDIASTPDLGAVVVGRANGDLDTGVREFWYRMVVRKYDFDGDPLWTTELDPSSETRRPPYDLTSVAVSPTGDIFVAGHGSTEDWDTYNFLSRLSPTGDLLWTVYPEELLGETNLTDFKLAATSNALYAGLSDLSDLPDYEEPDRVDALVVKFDLAGNVTWERRIDADGLESSRGVSVLTDGGVVVAGRTSGSLHAPNAGSFDTFLRRYSPSGALVWGVQRGSPARDEVTDVDTSPTDHVLLSVEKISAAAPNEDAPMSAALDSFRASGAWEWTTPWRASGTKLYSIDSAPNGVVFAVGLDGRTSHLFLSRFSPEGGRLAGGHRTSDENTHITGVAASGRGRAFVLGWTSGRVGLKKPGLDDSYLIRYGPLYRRSLTAHLHGDVRLRGHLRAFGRKPCSGGNLRLRQYVRRENGGYVRKRDFKLLPEPDGDVAFSFRVPKHRSVTTWVDVPATRLSNGDTCGAAHLRLHHVHSDSR
jgi:hypothetical protein